MTRSRLCSTARQRKSGWRGSTPRKKQPFGQAATRYNRSLSAQKIVTVKVETTDRYGRLVGEVFLPDGRSLNRELVRAGYAWWFRKYSKDQTIGELEDEAVQIIVDGVCYPKVLAIYAS